MESSVFAELLFPQAFQSWQKFIAPSISTKTQADYVCYGSTLSKFFGKLKLSEIEWGHISSFREARLSGNQELLPGSRKAGPSCVNHEIECVLRPILRLAGCWAKSDPWYRPIRLAARSSKRRAFTDEELLRIYHTGKGRKKWETAFCAQLISINTTACGSEIRFLRLRDVDIDRKQFYINEGAKNEHRKRWLPLNGDALWAFQRLLDRATERGAKSPDDYLLPHRAPNGEQGWDFSRPIGSWRKAWNVMLKAAGVDPAGFHCCRHTSISNFLMNPNISERTTKDLAGHVTEAMLKRYHHGRTATLQDAVSKVDAGLTSRRDKPYIITQPSDVAGKKAPCPITDIPSSHESSPQPSSRISADSSLSTFFYGSTLRLK